MRRFLAVTLVATACVVVTPTSLPRVHADGELEVATTTTFTIDPVAAVVHVVVEAAVTNLVADVYDDLGVTSHYYTGYGIPATIASTNAVAVDAAGRALAVTTRPSSDMPAYVFYDIVFVDELHYRQTARFTLTYDIVGQLPRSSDTTRVNPAYVGFNAFGWGDSGKVNVRIVVPTGYDVDVLGDPIDSQPIEGATLYAADAIADPLTFDVTVAARNDDALVRVPASSGESTFEVRSWPGDTDWQSFISTQIQTGLPQLAELVGQPWPIDDSVAVVEAYTPYLYGYAGWFSTDDRLIEVGEDLDPEVVLHELSHAWFNDEWFSERWLNEGLAQVYSNKVVSAMGGTAEVADPIDAADPGFVMLNQWRNPTELSADDPREDYGYNASYDVVGRIVAEVGDDAMRNVLDAVANDTIAYRGDLPPEQAAATTDWRRFLDLVEELGGSTSARSLLEQYVVSVSGPQLLATRDEARQRYGELLAAGGSWAGPRVIREHLSNWRFDAATTAIDEAMTVLAARDDMVDAATDIGVSYPDRLERDYEAVDGSFDTVLTEVLLQLSSYRAIAEVVEADDHPRGVLDRVGLWATDVPSLIDQAKQATEAGDHRAARDALDEAKHIIAAAADNGIRRIAVGVGGLVVLLLLATLLSIRRRRRRALRQTAATVVVRPPVAPPAGVVSAVAPTRPLPLVVPGTPAASGPPTIAMPPAAPPVAAPSVTAPPVASTPAASTPAASTGAPFGPPVGPAADLPPPTRPLRLVLPPVTRSP